MSGLAAARAVPWTERTPAVAHMLNPAFLAAILASAAHEYTDRSGRGMPFAYAYVVAPLLLHRQTRDVLPRNSTAHLSKWVAANQVICAGLPARAQQLRFTVDEGLRFALRSGDLVIDDGDLIAPRKLRQTSDLGDARAILTKATLIGRWFARVDRPATVFVLLGVAP